MSNQTTPSAPATEPGDPLSTWDEIRRVADELQLSIHLASMEARDRWRALEPRLTALEKRFAQTGQRAGEVVAKELSAVGTLIRRLRDDVANGK